METKIRKNKTYFWIKVVIIVYAVVFAIFVLFFDYLYPPNIPTLAMNPLSNNITLDLLKQISPFLYANHINFYHVMFAFSYTAMAVISIILFPGRKAWEIFVMVVCFVIPSQRKYSGLIYDQNSELPLPFSTIYLEQIASDGTSVFLTQVIADLDGQYRLNLEHVVSKIRLTVKREGYVDFVKVITPTVLTTKLDFMLDIPLKRVNQNANSFTDLLYKANLSLSNRLIYVVYFLSLFMLLLTITEIGLVAPFVTVLELVVYGIPFLWNTYSLYRRVLPRIGKILNSGNGGPVEGAVLYIYDLNKKQLGFYVSNNLGVINFDLKKGDYLATVIQNKYKTPPKYTKIGITSSGYLSANISLEPKDSLANMVYKPSSLINPFG